MITRLLRKSSFMQRPVIFSNKYLLIAYSVPTVVLGTEVTKDDIRIRLLIKQVVTGVGVKR